jgi:hypothetical protein
MGSIEGIPSVLREGEQEGSVCTNKAGVRVSMVTGRWCSCTCTCTFSVLYSIIKLLEKENLFSLQHQNGSLGEQKIHDQTVTDIQYLIPTATMPLFSNYCRGLQFP